MLVVVGFFQCVKAILFLDILKSRLNVNAANDMGDTPLHLAARWGYGNASFMCDYVNQWTKKTFVEFVGFLDNVTF